MRQGSQCQGCHLCTGHEVRPRALCGCAICVGAGSRGIGLCGHGLLSWSRQRSIALTTVYLVPGPGCHAALVWASTRADVLLHHRHFLLSFSAPPCLTAPVFHRLLKKQYGEDLQAEFKLPKITKRYKGEVLAVNLPSTVGAMARSRSSVIVPSAAAAGSAPGRGLERSNSLKPTRNGSVFVGAPPAAGIAATPASPAPSSPVPAAPVPNTPTPLALAMGDSSAQDDERPSSVSLSDPSRQSQSAVKAVRSPYQTQPLAPIGQSATGMERRTTISRLFLNVDQQPGAAGNLTRVHTGKLLLLCLYLWSHWDQLLPFSDCFAVHVCLVQGGQPCVCAMECTGSVHSCSNAHATVLCVVLCVVQD